MSCAAHNLSVPPLAPTRRDIDLEQGSVNIDIPPGLKSGEGMVGAPKTKAGIRKVYVPAHVMPVLRAHLKTLQWTLV